MFGLFKKKAPEIHIRKGIEVGEMRTWAMDAIHKLAEIDPDFQNLDDNNDIQDLSFVFHGMRIFAPNIGANTTGLKLMVEIPECNITKAQTIAEKAFAYRAIDHICRTCRGVRAHFHPESGNLIVGVESAGFHDQFRADTLIDLALYMLEQGVMEAHKYLGLEYHEVAPIRVDQWDGGYHYGEGISVFASAPDAASRFMQKKYKCDEVGNTNFSIELESGPVKYEILRFGYPNGYMVVTGTHGFRHAYRDDEKYVRIQERLAQDIQKDDDYDRKNNLKWNFRSMNHSTIAYFQEDGTFVLGEFGFANPRTDDNGKAFEGVIGDATLDIKYMTILAAELPEDLYSDEANRPN